MVSDKFNVGRNGVKLRAGGMPRAERLISKGRQQKIERELSNIRALRAGLGIFEPAIGQPFTDDGVYDPGPEWQTAADPCEDAADLMAALEKVTRVQRPPIEWRIDSLVGPCPFCRAPGWSLAVDGESWVCYACLESGAGVATWLEVVRRLGKLYFVGPHRVNLGLHEAEAMSVALP